MTIAELLVLLLDHNQLAQGLEMHNRKLIKPTNLIDFLNTHNYVHYAIIKKVIKISINACDMCMSPLLLLQ